MRKDRSDGQDVNKRRGRGRREGKNRGMTGVRMRGGGRDGGGWRGRLRRLRTQAERSKRTSRRF